MTFDAAAFAAAGAAAGATALLAWQRVRLSSRKEGMARASHELRGALGTIGLALSAIDGQTAQSRGWRERLGTVQTQHQRAVLAVDDLDAVLRSGTPAPASSTPIELEALVRRSVRSWAAIHGRWRVVLDWRVGPAVVNGHAARLNQVLDNLIANALEHGGGPVTVVARRAEGAVTVTVLDRGGGMHQSLESVRPMSRRSCRGHGLVIVRRAVEQHGGRIRLVRESRGSGVEIRLPLAPGAGDVSVTAMSGPVPRIPPDVARTG